jgi:hypothetical protein
MSVTNYIHWIAAVAMVTIAVGFAGGPSNAAPANGKAIAEAATANTLVTPVWHCRRWSGGWGCRRHW